MIDLQDRLKRFEINAAECERIAEFATNNVKRELHLRLALRFRDLAAGARNAITAKDAEVGGRASAQCGCS
jgi:hypothetical protein